MWFWATVAVCLVVMFVWEFRQSIAIVLAEIGLAIVQTTSAARARLRHRLRASRVRLKHAYCHWRRDRRHRPAHVRTF